MVALLINTFPVTLITEHNIVPPPVPVLTSDDSASTTSHLIQTWNIEFLLKQLLDSTAFTNQLFKSSDLLLIATIPTLMDYLHTTRP